MRYCFSLQVRPDRLDKYADRHSRVWPDMQAAQRAKAPQVGRIGCPARTAVMPER
jgi:L-rhamnose mutarotase